MRIIGAIFFGVLSLQVTAMTCSPRTVQNIADTAEVAFTGTIVSITESKYVPQELEGLCWGPSEGPRCGGKLATVHVTERLRGQPGDTATVLKQDGCYCTGGYWDVGKTYLFIAKPNDTKLRGHFVASNICGGTREVGERTARIVEALKAKK
jgi:hypothetical protein